MNTENIHEAIESSVEAVTVDIPVRVTMTSYDNTPFEFTASIDELGQIVLTPTSKDVEFIDANIDANVDFDVPVIEQETIETVEGSITTRETSIIIKASMLAEVENYDFSAIVDEIGQVVIYPVAEKNVFVTASFDHSLNLVTEDMKNVDYFGYKLVNTGDGWDVYDYTNELIDEGLATIAEAKILVCTTEINRLETLTEEVDSSKNGNNVDTSNENNDKDIELDVEAEVLEENINKHELNTIDVLTDITDSFTDTDGAVKCDTIEEKTECEHILNQHYNNVVTEKHDEYWVVTYSHTNNYNQENNDE